jgi:hypothetical protein
MKRTLKWFVAAVVTAVLGFAIVAYVISFYWPMYLWDLRLPSPDGRYDLVVLRGDAAAFADFSYHVYLFPHALVPGDRAKNTRVVLTSTWRGSKYLVYSGYNVPMFRWTGTHSIEIDLHDAYYEPFRLEHIKKFTLSDEPVLVSLVFEKDNAGNILP